MQNKREARAAMKRRLGLLKVQRGCVDCGYNQYAEALDWDHVLGTKVANVSKLVRDRVGWLRILAEIDKCVVRCANCHRVKTSERAGR